MARRGCSRDRAAPRRSSRDAAGRREAAVAARYRLQGGIERLELRAESADALLERFRARDAAPDEPRRRATWPHARARGRSRRELPGGRARARRRSPERASSSANGCARSTRRSPSRRGFRRSTRAAPRTALGSRSRRSTSQPGVRAARSQRARARAAAVIADDPAVGLALLQRARGAGLGSLTVLDGTPHRRRSSASIPVVPLEHAAATSRRPSVTREGFGYDPRDAASSGSWARPAEAVLLELRVGAALSRRRGRRARCAARGRDPTASETARACAHRSEAYGQAPRLRRRRSTGADRCGRLVESTTACRDAIDAARRRRRGSRRRFARRVDAGATRARRARRGAADARRDRGRTSVSELEDGERCVTARRSRSPGSTPTSRTPTRGGSRRRGRGRAGRGRRPRRACGARRAARRAARARSGRSTRSPARSTRRRRSASTEPEDAARRTSSAASRSSRSSAPSSPATVERRFAETFDAVAAHFEEVAATLFPGGEGRLATRRARERGGDEPGRRGRAAARGQAHHAPLAALGRREGARRDLVPLRALPRAAVRVLPPRRGRGGARRHQHRALRRAAAPLRRPRAVRRRHAPEADDGGRRHPLRRDDGRRDGVSQVVSRRLPQHQQLSQPTA